MNNSADTDQQSGLVEGLNTVSMEMISTTINTLKHTHGSYKIYASHHFPVYTCTLEVGSVSTTRTSVPKNVLPLGSPKTLCSAFLVNLDNLLSDYSFSL